MTALTVRVRAYSHPVTGGAFRRVSWTDDTGRARVRTVPVNYGAKDSYADAVGRVFPGATFEEISAETAREGYGLTFSVIPV